MLYIIFCNDSPEKGYLNEAKAKIALAKLKKAETDSAKYWHIHEVKLES